MSLRTSIRPSTPAAAVAASVRAKAAERARRRTRWLRFGLGVLVLALLGAVVWAACFSSLLAVRKVTVVGLDRLSTAEVLRVAHVPTGGSEILLDTTAPAARVRALPQVAAVHLERALPHSVRIVVTERTPVLVLQTPAGRRLVDASGVVFAVDDGNHPDLPVVRTELADPAPGTLDAVTAMLAALPAAIRPEVQVVRADSPDDMKIGLGDGRVIVWGDSSRPTLKARVLTILLQQDGRTYDVSSPEAPAIARPDPTPSPTKS